MSQLMNWDIVDANNKNIGRLIDAVLKITPTGMEVTKFIVGDSKIVELLERMKFRPDIDPIFPIELIQSVKRGRIVLSMAKEQLKSTHIHRDVFDENEVKFTVISKIPVYGKSGKLIGKIVDLKFEDSKFQLILGHSVFEEWAEDVGLSPDVDFLLDPTFISSFSKDKIVLNKQQEELKTTFLKHFDEYQSKMKAGEIRSLTRSSFYLPTMR